MLVGLEHSFIRYDYERNLPSGLVCWLSTPDLLTLDSRSGEPKIDNMS